MMDNKVLISPSVFEEALKTRLAEEIEALMKIMAFDASKKYQAAAKAQPSAVMYCIGDTRMQAACGTAP